MLKANAPELVAPLALMSMGAIIVLGGSRYVGGWLYQTLARETTPFTVDPEIDEQIRLIRDLLSQGYHNARIVAFLIEQEVLC